MPRSGTRLTRAVPSLAVAAILTFGAHTAFASPAEECSSNPTAGTIGLSCTAGPTGDSYCTSQCRSRYGWEVSGECSAPFGGCCLCML